MPTNRYINIGNEKCCMYVNMSVFLSKQLEIYPALHDAVAEAVLSAQNQHYAVGIITFAQLLNILNQETPADRHIVAHQILKQRPTKEMYDEAEATFKAAATTHTKNELARCGDTKIYLQKVSRAWNDFMRTRDPNWRDIDLSIVD